jgi:hypothetical protein
VKTDRYSMGSSITVEASKLPFDDARFLHEHGLPFSPKPLPWNGAELEEMVRELVARIGRADGDAPARESPAPKAGWRTASIPDPQGNACLDLNHDGGRGH